MDLTLPGIDFEMWLFESQISAEEKIQQILDQGSILGYNKKEILQYLKEQQKQLAEGMMVSWVGKSYSMLIKDNLYSEKLPKILIIKMKKCLKRDTISDVGDLASEFAKVVESLYTIDGITHKINEINNPESSKTPLTFEGLFANHEHAELVRNRFSNNGYTIGNKWVGESGHKTELLAAYYVLKSKEIFKRIPITPGVTAFYQEFGLTVGKDISERMVRNPPENQDRSNFERLFSDLKN